MASPVCEIQWIDQKNGEPTPDSKQAIGRCWIVAHEEVISGRRIPIPESQHYFICADHAKRLHGPGMHYWRFEPLKEGDSK
jgi:hypothetical protein